MKKILFATAALVALSTSGALAQQNQQQNYQYQSLSPLSGFYVGGIAGYTDGDDHEGGDYGVFVGYKLDKVMGQTDRTDLGMNAAIEAHYIWSDDSGAYEKDTEWGVSFRPGFTVLDQMSPFGLNPYGIIGYKRAEFENPTTTNYHHGFELGIGTEVLAHENVGLRLEYAHTWYGSETGYDPNEHTFRAGLAYHF